MKETRRSEQISTPKIKEVGMAAASDYNSSPGVCSRFIRTWWRLRKVRFYPSRLIHDQFRSIYAHTDWKAFPRIQ